MDATNLTNVQLDTIIQNLEQLNTLMATVDLGLKYLLSFVIVITLFLLIRLSYKLIKTII